MAFEDSSHEVIYQSSNSSDYDDDDCDKLNVIEALNDKCNLFFSKMKVYKEKCTYYKKRIRGTQDDCKLT